MPSKKKKYNARFPPARIKKIMQMDEDVGKVAATVPVIISRALELFIESIIQQATQTTLSKNAKTLSTSHIKQTIESQERYSFLRELVANVPDHQVEEEVAACTTSSSSNYNNGDDSSALVKRPRGRPRKQKDGGAVVQSQTRGRVKRKKESSESSESENSEETDDAEEETDDEPADSLPSTSFCPTTFPASSSSSAAGAIATTTTSATMRNGDLSTTGVYDKMSARLQTSQTTTLSNPPPLAQLLGQSQAHQQHPQHHQQQYQHHQQVEHFLQQQNRQYQQQSSEQQTMSQQSLPQSCRPMVSMAVTASMPSPSMMPAAMPSMYQSMPGMAPARMYSWPGPSTKLPEMLQHGFSPMTTQGSAFPGSQASALLGFPSMGYPGMPPAHLSGYSINPVPGSGIGMYREGVRDTGSAGYPGLAKSAPVVSAPGSGEQAEDDYDT